MNYAIIVAGGIGTRMAGSKIPKQFIEIAGKPVIVHTIENFLKSVHNIKIIIPLPVQWLQLWEEIKSGYFPENDMLITEGGETRFHSVKNALKLTTSQSVVAIHDSVRPVVSAELIKKAFNHARDNKTAIPVIEVSESMRKKNINSSSVVNRNDFLIIQTPQCFQQEILVKAYDQKYSEKFTDDATVVEESGVSLSYIEGNRNNIKITVQEDLLLAECLLKNI